MSLDKAVVALKAALAEQGAWCGVCDFTDGCEECDQVRESYARAALPLLEAHFRERFAQELDERAHSAGNVYARHSAHAAARFLRRGPRE